MKLTYIQQSGSPPVGDGGDQYTGLDRFGRVIDQRWVKVSSGVDLERVKYGYSRASNRVWRDNTVADATSANQDEYYTYDGLYQVQNLDRGQLNTGKTGINGTPTWEEDWNYDGTGNWHGSSSAYVTKVSGTTTLDQNRSHNVVNEITNISTNTGTAWPTPAQDAAGNLTSLPQPLNLGRSYTLTWDAWNRLMTVKDGSTTVGAYRYDGASRRVTKNARHYYYSDQWQILEERLNNSTTSDRQFVWGARSIDDLIVRDDTLRRLYALSDAMGSITAVVNTSGTVQERYGYNGFGTPRYMNASFGSQLASNYDWETLFDGYRYDTLFGGYQYNSDTGFYQVRYRYLHPALGRWLSRDPLGEPGFEVLRRQPIPLLIGEPKQNWPNKDPLGEQGFEVLRTGIPNPFKPFVKPSEYFSGPDLYTFVKNDSIDGRDPFGLIHVFYECPNSSRIVFGGGAVYKCNVTGSLGGGALWAIACMSPQLTKCIAQSVGIMNLGCALSDASTFAYGCEFAGNCFRTGGQSGVNMP